MNRVLIIIIIILPFIDNTVSSTYDTSILDATPNVNEWIEENHTITVINYTTLRINSVFDVHELLINGSKFTADDLRLSYTIDPKVTDKLNETIQKKYYIFLNQSFPGAFDSTNYSIQYQIGIDFSSLNSSNDNDPSGYQPPIIYRGSVSLSVTPRTFGITVIRPIDDLIKGTFTMGGELHFTINTSVNPGYNRTFTLQSTEPSLKFNKHGSKWNINNLNAGLNQYKNESDVIIMKAKTPNVQQKNINVNALFDFYDFDNLTFNASVYLYAISVDTRTLNLTNIMNFTIVTSDGIRMYYQYGLLNLTYIYEEFIKNYTKSIEENLTIYLKTNVSLYFFWDYSTFNAPYNTSLMRTIPPIRAYMKSSKIIPAFKGKSEYNIDGEFLRTLFGSGAKYKFSVPYINTTYDGNVTIKLPNGTRFIELNGSRIADINGQTRLEYIFPINSIPQLTLTGEKYPIYKEDKIEVNATIDLAYFESSVKNEYIVINLTVNLSYYHFKTPDELKKYFPENFTLDFVNADIIRMAYKKNLLTTTDFENMSATIKSYLEGTATLVAGESVFFESKPMSNLTRPVNTSNIVDNPPVAFNFFAQVRKSLLELAQSLKSDIILKYTLNFPLRGVYGVHLNYTIYVPANITILSVKTNHHFEIVKSPDNRNGRVFYFNSTDGSSDNVIMVIGINLTYDMMQLLPFLQIVVGLATAWLGVKVYAGIKKKRRRVQL